MRRKPRYCAAILSMRPVKLTCLLAGTAVAVILFATGGRTQDKLLEETAEFTGQVLFLQSRVPALVLGVVRGDQTAVFGFGETADASGKLRLSLSLVHGATLLEN